VPNLARDTMLTQHVLFSCMKKSLDFQSSLYCNYHLYWKEEGKEYHESWSEDQFWRYNCIDAVRTFEIDTVQQPLVDRMGYRAVHDFQQTLWWPVLQTMCRGLRVDEKQKGQLALELIEAIDQRKSWLYNVLGYELNIRSSMQMKTLFYEEFALKPIKNRKTGALSCDEESLRKLCEREPLLTQLVNVILDMRSLMVFLSTFINAPLDIDHRMRCSFNIPGTETYRFSSSENAFGSGMNLQNVPKGGKLADPTMTLPNVRKLFIPDPGMEYFDTDLSAADLHIVVWESDCKEMKQMLREGYDPYTEIAKEFYNDPSINKKDDRRQKFKSLAHGTHYLGTAAGLAGRLGLSVHEVDRVQKWYFRKYPEIKQNQERLIKQVTERRFVQNIFGYRYHFFDRIEGTVFNQAAAWIPQSTVACIINRAYVNIWKHLPEVQILLQVHDSLAGQYPANRAETFRAAILQEASVTLPYADPLVIPIGIATSTSSWGECK
jgi:DNA polymerase-1